MVELSEEIGISRATLSKYFQDPARVRGSTVRKIETALARIDYTPNFFARNMNRRSTGIIGVVLPHLHDMFYMALLDQIERRAEELDLQVVVQNSHGTPGKEARSLEVIRSMNAEGLIVAPVGTGENAPTFRLLGEEMPVVFVDARCAGLEKQFSFVGTDNYQSFRLMIDYLRRTGEAPAFLGMPRVNSNSDERQAAYVHRMTELGLSPRILECQPTGTPWDFEAIGYLTIKVLLKNGLDPSTTILCANDRLAMGGVRAANEAGVSWPTNGGAPAFRIAGHDDHPLSQYMWPGITTVYQDVARIGRAAVDQLFAESRGKSQKERSPVDLLFPTQLRIRDSA